MLIFESKKDKGYFKLNFKNLINKLKSKRKITILFFGSALLGSFFFMPLNLGIKYNPSSLIFGKITRIAKNLNLDSGFTLEEIYINDTRAFDIVSRYILSLSQKENFIDLSIKLKDLNKLRGLRNKAIFNNILTRTNNDEFKAKLNYKGIDTPIRIRLKGDYFDHLIGEKWSYRVKTRKNSSFLGMREFSIQHPRTRNYINEFIYHSFLQYEGLPFLRYDFLTLRLNGKNLGTYAIEESFDKILIENSRYREGPIIKFNEDLKWLEEARMNYKSTIKDEIYTSSYWQNNTNIEVFNKNRLLNDEKKISQANLAKNLLNEFLLKKKTTSEVFDLTKTAKYFAIHDLLNSDHPYLWHNIRFYYDPILARLIPIGYDAQYKNQSINNSLSIDKNPFGIFEDKEFVKEYIKQLERLSTEENIKKFFVQINDDLKRKLKAVHRSYPHIKFNKKIIFQNLSYIEKRLNQFSPIHVKQKSNLGRNIFGNDIVLSLYNKSIFPIKILKVEDNNYDYKFENEIILSKTSSFNRIKSQEFNFKLVNKKSPSDAYKNKLFITYKLHGSNKIHEELIDYITMKPPISINSDLITKEPNYESFPFLNVNSNNKTITFKKGNWKILKPLILPRDHKLIIQEGTNIETKFDGIIIANGPVEIKGLQDYPIKITATNGGKGLLVLNALEKSIINNVIFSGLSDPKLSSLSIMGAINFYNSEVIISNSLFKNISAEDALNIVKSNFKISNTSFENISSDAFDSDFSDGLIVDSNFTNIGNDAIDLSGSRVKILSTTINNSGDKALSIGERSFLEASKLNISNSRIGIASKDLSIAKINNLNLINNKICFAAFQKKPEYGPGSIEIKSKEIFNSCESYILEEGSNIYSKYKSLIPNTKKAFDLLYVDEQ